ncbi:methyltransferase domain-containing protein [bacterium]|jgi:spore coat polysaccharide biosynthesis protein SpsF|nr:methyltransferase domain-containing protein [bacterium]
MQSNKGRFKTEQEVFWSGEFGDNYIDRNRSKELLSANTSLFASILSSSGKIDSILEFGCNIGMNLESIKSLLPEVKLSGIEINKKAISKIKNLEQIEVFHDSILEIEMDRSFDLTLIKTVLIHINPEELDKVYSRLYKFSNKYICIAEYYSPSPVEVNYRGHSDKLFKRDFAGELMRKYPDLDLIDYGFIYHNDPVFPQDDINWFLLMKK